MLVGGPTLRAKDGGRWRAGEKVVGDVFSCSQVTAIAAATATATHPSMKDAAFCAVSIRGDGFAPPPYVDSFMDAVIFIIAV